MNSVEEGRHTVHETTFLILFNPIIFLVLREERDRRDLGPQLSKLSRETCKLRNGPLRCCHMHPCMCQGYLGNFQVAARRHLAAFLAVCAGHRARVQLQLQRIACQRRADMLGAGVPPLELVLV
jgi:hypothetical protein